MSLPSDLQERNSDDPNRAPGQTTPNRGYGNVQAESTQQGVDDASATETPKAPKDSADASSAADTAGDQRED